MPVSSDKDQALKQEEKSSRGMHKLPLPALSDVQLSNLSRAHFPQGLLIYG